MVGRRQFYFEDDKSKRQIKILQNGVLGRSNSLLLQIRNQDHHEKLEDKASLNRVHPEFNNELPKSVIYPRICMVIDDDCIMMIDDD